MSAHFSRRSAATLAASRTKIGACVLFCSTQFCGLLDIFEAFPDRFLSFFKRFDETLLN